MKGSLGQYSAIFIFMFVGYGLMLAPHQKVREQLRSEFVDNVTEHFARAMVADEDFTLRNELGRGLRASDQSLAIEPNTPAAEYISRLRDVLMKLPETKPFLSDEKLNEAKDTVRNLVYSELAHRFTFDAELNDQYSLVPPYQLVIMLILPFILILGMEIKTQQALQSRETGKQSPAQLDEETSN